MMLYVVILLLAAIGAVIYFTKTGKIKDSDGDFIPDSVEEAAEKAKVKTQKTVAKVKETAKKIETKVENAVDDVKEIVSDIKDTAEIVSKAAKEVKNVTTTRSKPRRNKNKN